MGRPPVWVCWAAVAAFLLDVIAGGALLAYLGSHL